MTASSPRPVPLRSDASQAAALYMSREYRRANPALDFKDRELVELLQGFTRAAERPVLLGFGERNIPLATWRGRERPDPRPRA